MNSSPPRAGAELLRGSALGEADLKHSETPLLIIQAAGTVVAVPATESMWRNHPPTLLVGT